MNTDYDTIVVGGGVMGTAAAHELALSGRATLLIERFTIGHKLGSSGGPTRILRLAYADPKYVRMARSALDTWRQLEDRAGESLFVTTGGIDVGEGARDSANAMESSGVACEWMPAREALLRWPGLRFDDDPNVPILHQPDAGVCFAERAVLAQARLAREAGAAILEETTVRSIVPSDAGVELATDEGETFRAPVAIVAAGPWAGPLLRGADIDLPLEPSLEQVSFFEMENPSPLPAVLDWTTATDRGGGKMRMFYTVPNPEEPGAFKIGWHHSGGVVDPNDGPFAPDPERVTAVETYAAERYAAHHVSAPTDTCLYTDTPDGDFVVDRVGPLVVASPCSGHGFKFGPLIGKVVAALATGGESPVPLDAFRIGRLT